MAVCCTRPAESPLMAAGQSPPALVRQLTDQPFGLERVAEPGFCPAMRNTGADKSGMEMLALFVEQRELAARLLETARQIAALNRVRPAVALRMIVYG